MDATTKGKWNQIQGRIKKAWGELTDDEVAKTEGDLDKLAGLIQEKYGQAADAAKRQIAELVQNVQGEDADDEASPVGASAGPAGVPSGTAPSRRP